MKCMVCGKEIYTSPDSVRCFGCASGYKSLRPTSKPVVPSDCVPKDDLLKLVEEMDLEIAITSPAPFDRGHNTATRKWKNRIRALLKGGGE